MVPHDEHKDHSEGFSKHPAYLVLIRFSDRGTPGSNLFSLHPLRANPVMVGILPLFLSRVRQKDNRSSCSISKWHYTWTRYYSTYTISMRVLWRMELFCQNHHHHHHHQSTSVEIAMPHHRGLFAIAWASLFRTSPVSLAKVSGYMRGLFSLLGQRSLHNSRLEITWCLARKQWPANLALLSVLKIGGSSP